MATLGLEKHKLDPDRQQEGRDYVGRILSVYPELLKIDTTLPTTAAAQEYQKVSAKQHEAMLRYSGMPELTRDMQALLTNSRYEVQLRQAETQLALALQQLEDLCWEQLNQHGIQSRDLQELQQEIALRQSKRGAIRFEQVQRRTGTMRVAWRDALKAFDTVILTDNNAYHQALLTAHDRASRRIPPCRGARPRDPTAGQPPRGCPGSRGHGSVSHGSAEGGGCSGPILLTDAPEPRTSIASGAA